MFILKKLGVTYVGAFLFFSSISFAATVTPLKNQPGYKKLPAFVGSSWGGAPPIQTSKIPQNSYMASNGRSNIHNDIYLSDTYRVKGISGNNPVVLSNYLNGESASITFDQSNNLIMLTGGLYFRRLQLMNPNTLEIISTFKLPFSTKQALSWGGGGYFYLDNNDLAIVPTMSNTRKKVEENPETYGAIWVISKEGEKFNQTPTKYPLLAKIPESEEDSIISILPDSNGMLWFATVNGYIGTLNRDNGKVKYANLHEGIYNTFALDEKGGVYFVTSSALYKFSQENGQPFEIWRSNDYPNVGITKNGQKTPGSGASPTLMGKKYVAITDNGNPMSVIVYRRDTGESYCSAKVFTKNMDAETKNCGSDSKACYQSSTENSLIATDKSIVVENNYYTLNKIGLKGKKTYSKGVARVDINKDNTCHVKWENYDESVPSVVSKLSLKNRLIYTYTKDIYPQYPTLDPWYLTTIDFDTGKTIFKVLSGTGYKYNNHYAALYLSPLDDGTVYIGTMAGIVKISDSKDLNNSKH